jgi:hypothetical protein
MILNVYVYKGPIHSVIEPWVVLGFITEKDSGKEKDVPCSKKIYKHRKSIDKFSFLIERRLYVKYIDAFTINTVADYSVYVEVKKLITWGRTLDSNVEINIVSNPILWYERLTVLLSVYYRRIFISRKSYEVDLNRLDRDWDKHLDVICRYKYLPPMYIWSKTIESVEFIYPKPSWYQKEIQTLKECYEYN